MDQTGHAEKIIQDIAGCGKFQALVVLLVYAIPKITGFFTVLFMSFGYYNPGWRCMDNATSPAGWGNTTGPASQARPGTGNASLEYTVGTCEAYKACRQVEFNPDVLTIVTEWGLICDESWIATLITSLQMAGLLVGSFLAGQLGDMLGRKTVLYTAFAMNAIFALLSVFSVSWQMFALVRFLLGISLACIFAHFFVLMSEFMTIKWRAIITPMPMFHVGGVIFAVTTMVLRNWRYVELNCVFWSVVSFIPVVWVPESLRWLEVKNKKKQFIRVAEKITATNGTPLPPLQDISLISCEEKDTKVKQYTFLDLFRRGYRLYTVLLGFLWMAMSFIYYAISLGAKNLSGDFFLNLIILNAIEIPFCVFPMSAPNVLGRRRGTGIFLVVATLASFISAALLLWAPDPIQSTGTLVLTLLAIACINAAWYILHTHTAEIYPTVVRSLAQGWGSFASRIGGIAAPFIISDDPALLYIFHLVMGVVSLFSCIALMNLPETKGKPLKEKFPEPNCPVDPIQEKEMDSKDYIL